MRTLEKIVLLLVIVGAINWGLVGFFKYNLVDSLFGVMSWLSMIIYAIIGLSGLYCIKMLVDHD